MTYALHRHGQPREQLQFRVKYSYVPAGDGQNFTQGQQRPAAGGTTITVTTSRAGRVRLRFIGPAAEENVPARADGAHVPEGGT